MKSRIFAIIMILVLGIGSVILLFKTISHMTPEQAQVDQNILAQAIIQSPEPEMQQVRVILFMQPASDLSDRAVTNLMPEVSPDVSETIQSGSNAIPWSPPIQYQTLENLSNDAQFHLMLAPSINHKVRGKSSRWAIMPARQGVPSLWLLLDLRRFHPWSVYQQVVRIHLPDILRLGSNPASTSRCVCGPCL